MPLEPTRVLKYGLKTVPCFLRSIFSSTEHSDKMNKEPSPCSTIRPLSGKVAIVTGSSRNIGAAIAEQLAADGADVVINYHGVDACASQIARGINSRKGGRAIFVKADVSTIEGGEHLLEECVRRFGVPDILVLNASVIGHRTLEKIDEDYYQLLMDTNVKGPLFLSQAAAKLMKPGQYSLPSIRFSSLLN